MRASAVKSKQFSGRSVATIYAVLVAAIGETLAGVMYLLRGQGYQASILCGFGLWLCGLISC